MADHDTKHDHDMKHDRSNEPGHAIAALFPSRAEARAAVGALHKAKLTHTWLGTTSIAETSAGEPTVTVESGGFFSGTQSLVEALVSRGVLGDSARSLEAEIEPGNAVLSVDPKDHSFQEAVDVLTRFGGRIADNSPLGEWPAYDASVLTDFNGDEVFEEALFARR